MLSKRSFVWLATLLLATAMAPALADDYTDAIAVFQKASESKSFFGTAHGYAVFPTVGKGGIVVGAAHGDGRVYEKGKYVGDVSMTQLSVGAQLGGQAFSEIIFLQDKRAFDEFTKGEFEFGAEVSAVAITAGVSAEATTGGTGAGKSITSDKAEVRSTYQKGIAVFTVAKGGLMYEATVKGQKFTYKKK
ncbi:MAG TPA: lipid-binding SYLF domain-containing protein [Burkholderiaceae bacterium]|nr:lipid-binding SYLF domain-containing protein [Burkholderiaceae bacterium]